jgi:cobalt-zinc-cadmium efflux system outer membrane protein
MTGKGIVTGVLICAGVWRTPWSHSAAANGEDLPLSLDLPTAITRALQENPDLQAKRQGLGVAHGRVQQAELLFQDNPRLSVDTDVRSRRYTQPAGRTGADVEVRLLQEIEIAGQRGYRREAAAAHLAQAEAAVADAEREVRREVARSFYELRALHEALAVRHDVLTTQDSLLQAGQTRFDRGDISILELDTLRLDRDRTQSDITRQEEERVSKEHQLRLLLGVEEYSPMRLIGSIETLLPGPTRSPLSLIQETLTACAVDHRPDVTAARLAVVAREAELHLAHARRVPNIAVGPLYKLDNEDQVVGGALSIPLPFFNRNQHEITAAMANLQVDRTAPDARIRAVRHEVAAALARVQLTARQLASYGTTYLSNLTESTAHARKAYEAGEMTIFEFSVAVDRLVQTRLRYLEAALAFLQAKAEVDAQSAFQCVDDIAPPGVER